MNKKKSSRSNKGLSQPGSADHTNAQRTFLFSPVRLITIISFAVFVYEVFVMLMLQRLMPFSDLFKAIIDASILVVLLFPVLYYLFFRPILIHNTSLRQAEKALRESEEKYRSYISNSPEGVFVVNQQGKYLEVNEAACQMAGYSEKELLSISVAELVAPEARDKVLADFHKLTSEGRLSSEALCMKKDGTRFYLSIAAVKISGDRFIGFSSDITERKRAEQARIESEEKFRLLVETALFGIVVHKNNKIVYTNPGFQKIVRALSAGDIIGRTLTSFVARELLPVTADSIKTTANDRKPTPTVVESMKCMDGATVEVTISSVPINFEGQPAAYSIINDVSDLVKVKKELEKHHQRLEELVKNRTAKLEDSQRALTYLMEDVNQSRAELEIANRNLNIEVKERRLREEEVRQYATRLEAVNKELEAFSYSVSHDLKAPLRAIDGFSMAVIEDYAHKLDDEGRELLNLVSENAKNMGQLINDLLSLSRLGRTKFQMVNLDMEKIVRLVFQEQIKLHEERNIDFQLHKLTPAVGDRSMIKQVFVNLISNALKFTGYKEKTVIEIGCQKKGAENIYFIKDNGAGFNMKYVHKLFGVFQRLHTTEEFAGTGIGLALLQRIISRHGGRVWAEGMVDQGAEFYFTLPGS